MNICIVSNQVKKTFSGIGLHTNNLIKGLTNHGHRVWVIAPEEQRPLDKGSFTFISVPKPLFGNNQARWISLSWNFARAVQNLIDKQLLDLIHFTDARESLFYHGRVPAVGNINDTYSAELHSLSYYRQYYSDWYIRWLYYHFVHVFEKKALQKLNAVIANSQFTAEVSHRQYSVDSKKLFTCYKSIDPDRYAVANVSRSTSPTRPARVLFVGTNMQRKGLPMLIQSAPMVIKKIPDVEFWVVGEDKVLSKMKSLCAQIGVLPNFKFLGWQNQDTLINQIYLNTDVFVMPSITEALGMVFVEAMASGIPVIGTETGGIPEIIEDRVNGRLITYGDVQTLAEAITEIILDPLIAKQYRSAGLKTVDRFTLQQMMLCTLRIYDAVWAVAN